MKFRPLHDRVVVRRVEQESKTAGGIIIPDTAKEKPQEGEVIAVGSGVRDESGKVQPLDVKAGDRVLFGKWSGTGWNMIAVPNGKGGFELLVNEIDETITFTAIDSKLWEGLPEETRGLCAALVGLIISSQLVASHPATGQAFELNAIAAAVLGGTSMSGGRGRIGGTIIGAFVIGVLSDGAGDDRYEGVRYVQGAGVHGAIGLLADGAGNDS